MVTLILRRRGNAVAYGWNRFAFPGSLRSSTRPVGCPQHARRHARALVGIVLLFVVYVIYQQLQIYRFRSRLLAQEELFCLIGENAADMIAVVTVDGRRHSPAPVQTVLSFE